jgi:hypothetical protein
MPEFAVVFIILKVGLDIENIYSKVRSNYSILINIKVTLTVGTLC